MAMALPPEAAAQETAAVAAIDRRRQLEEERKSRIFDPKLRLIGVDKQALDEQVAERSRIRQLEDDRDRFYDDQRVAMDEHAVSLQKESEKARAIRDGQVEQYRATFQRKDMRREWDLSNPRRVIDDIPTRLGDDDPRNGPASMQRLTGEDLSRSERRRAQAAQARRWAQQQVDERDARKWAELEVDRRQAEAAEAARMGAEQAAHAQLEHRRAIARADAEFNRQLADARKLDESVASDVDRLRGRQEVAYTLSSPFLTEDPDAERHALVGDRVRRDHFKGFRPDQSAAVLDAQALQRAERHMLRCQERQRGLEEGAETLAADNLRQRLEASRQRERREAAVRVAEEQKRQAAEAAERRRQERALYRGEVSTEFLSKFNTTAR
eukprot:TRINITY_DN57662_c0_g1_i1.p1 TRINITY_DN57662_c0_g1~~TRINITY_DN57662_c0_g1_i1.p1  ORF type:complete len:383 (+),score=76.30 TRINITY_DN57662_c0_g1_i1:82-1230(+)